MTTKQHSIARISQWSFRTWTFHLFKHMRLEEDDWELLDDEELLRLGLRYSSFEYVWAYSKGWRLMYVLRTQGNRERKTNKTSKRRKRRKGRKRREESWKWKKRKAQTGAAGSRGVWIWHRFRGSSTQVPPWVDLITLVRLVSKNTSFPPWVSAISALSHCPRPKRRIVKR